MLSLKVDKDFVIISDYDDRKGVLPIKTNLFIGNIISMLEYEFPQNSPQLVADRITRQITDGLSSRKDTSVKIWGLPEYGAALLDINEYINGRSFFYPSLSDVENMRISHFIETAPLPYSQINPEEGIYFSRIDSVFHAIIAVLYYYALNGYALRKCKLCGKWFAIPNGAGNPKEAFCDRKFVYLDWEGKEKQFSNCKEARENISARLEQRRRKIYKVLNSEGGHFSEVDTFYGKAQTYKDAIKKDPSIENLTAYEKYLYLDCQKYYRRYRREK